MIRLFLKLCGLLLPLPLFAERIPVEQAQRLAEGLFRSPAAAASAAMPDASRLRLIWDGEPAATRSGAEPALYVFARPEGGFAVIAADDAVRPVLGYSPTGRFSTDRMPANVREWFAGLRRQIANVRQAGIAPTPAIRRAWQEVSPRAIGTVTLQLETAAWNQLEPYNDRCPLIGRERAVTGCVPTALAIVMRYHRWPKNGTGLLPDYTYELDGTQHTVEGYRLGNAYAWDDMPLVYDETATSVQRRAVAALMYDLGVMSQASYNTAAAGGTGALTHIAVQGLLEHMRYDKRAELRYRDWGIPAAQWDEAIRRELRENGPVLYSGASEDAGHQFVIDGCTSTDYFHVNWGWGGYADGYFLLSALDPDGVGTGGGSGDGFDFGQSAVVGLRKDETGTSTYSDLLLVGTGEGNDQVTYHGLSASTDDFVSGRSFTMRICYLWNYGLSDFDGEVVLAVCDRNDAFREEISQRIDVDALKTYSGIGWSGIGCKIAGAIRSGDRIRLRYKGAEGVWKWADGSDEEAVFELLLRDDPPAGQIEPLDATTSLAFDRASRLLTLTTQPGVTCTLTASDGSTAASGASGDGTEIRIQTARLKGRYTLLLEKETERHTLTLNF